MKFESAVIIFLWKIMTYYYAKILLCHIFLINLNFKKICIRIDIMCQNQEITNPY